MDPNIAMFFFLMLTHCEPPRRPACNILKDRIEWSYNHKTTFRHRYRLWERYDDLDCARIIKQNP